MAEQQTDVAKVTTPTQGGRRDRVAMLSIGKDGVPVDVNPELIGDKEAVRENTREQFRQNAVAAADDEYRLEKAAAAASAEEVSQDPEIAARQKVHAKVEAAAEKAADKVVDQLHQG